MKQLKARVISDGTTGGTKVLIGREDQDQSTWEEVDHVNAVGFQIEAGSLGWVDLRLSIASVDVTGELGAVFAGGAIAVDERYMEGE